MIGLSNGKTIDAGYIGVGGSSNVSADKTFADYEVGTRFYLTYPTGEFDVPADVDDNGDPIVFHFSSVYYELTVKRDFDDPDAWEIADRASGLFTEFLPYDVTVHIEGYTNPSLAGWRFDVTFSSVTYSGGNSYRLQIQDDGYFSLDYPQKDWYMPKSLYFDKIILFE